MSAIVLVIYSSRLNGQGIFYSMTLAEWPDVEKSQSLITLKQLQSRNLS